MKILTTYYSWTGNTKKVAYAIHSQIGGDIMPMSEVKSWQEYDFLALGFFVDRGFSNDEAKKFMEQINGKNIGIFATAGVDPNHQYAKDVMKKVKDFMQERGNKVKKEFICQGAIDPKLIEKMKKMAKNDPHIITDERKQRWEAAKSHPDEQDLENAKKAFDSIN